MRRDTRILLATVLFAGAWITFETAGDALSDLNTFQVRKVEVRGARFLDDAAVVTLLRLDEASSIWEDPAPWIERLTAHPLVRDAEIRRRFPGGLVVTISERRPIALAATPVLEPVDAEGFRLPVDPTRHRLDLPVLMADRPPAPRARLFPSEVRGLARELDHLIGADTVFLQRASELSWESERAIRVRWTEPPVDLVLPVGVSPARLRDGLSALVDALARSPDDPPAEIDLRFADQVVVRRTREQRR